MIELREARHIIDATIVQAVKPTRASLAQAHGKWLREDVVAAEDMPHFDRSAVDGYAIAREDRSDRFRVIGECQAGTRCHFEIARGECVRIFTGGVLPHGATQVLMQEEVHRDGDWMIPTRRSDVLHVRHRGEDARRGDVLMPAGTLLSAGGCALLAHAGHVSPLVSPPLRVLHVATGNELIDPAATPDEGEIRDCNSTLVAALLAQHHLDLVRWARCKDTLKGLIGCIEADAANAWDAVLISGGASMGDYDFGSRALIQCGFTVHFDRVNLRPGKPTIFASRGEQIAFVIPGNPLAHFVVFYVLILHALQTRAATSAQWPMTRIKRCGDVTLERDQRETFWPARLRFIGGEMAVEALRWRSSGDISALPFADALIRIAPNTDVAGADVVDALLLDSFCRNSDVVSNE
jgi:molybdopterin molybdotransferase